MAFAALIPAAASIVGGLISGNAAKSAASKQAEQQQQALQFQQGVYNTAQTNLQPYLGGGQQALQSLLGFYGMGNNPQGAQSGFNQFTNTPFYQFPLQQSQLALNRQLASSGLIGSGAALRDGTQLASGYASQGLQSYLSGLSGLAGSGQTAASQIAQAGGTAGGQIGTTQTNLGNAQAAGIVGQNNSLMQGFQNATPTLSNFLGGMFGAPNPASGSSSSYTPQAYTAGTQFGNWLGIGGGGGGSVGTGPLGSGS